MPGAIIRIDQVRPGPVTSAGTAGVSRDDVWLSNLVNLVSTVGGNTNQQWTLLDAPTGSTTTLGTPTATTSSFTPDVPGTYRIQLSTNSGAQVQVLLVGVTKGASGLDIFHAWRIPAYREKGSEGNFPGNNRGWATAIETILKGIDTIVAAAQAAAQAASQPLDPDLTAIAALSTTSFGRSFLDRADAAAARTLMGLGSAATASTSAFDAAGAAAAAVAAEASAVRTLTNKTLSAPTVTGTVIYQGTKLRVLSIPGEVGTAAITTAVIAQFSILDETSVKLDFTASMKATGVNAKAGGFSGSATYMRSAGGAPTLVGAAAYSTQQRTVAGDDVTFDIAGNVVRVLASSADVDGRNWTCEFRVAETLST